MGLIYRVDPVERPIRRLEAAGYEAELARFLG
jgi:hypothetical protein